MNQEVFNILDGLAIANGGVIVFVIFPVFLFWGFSLAIVVIAVNGKNILRQISERQV